MSGTVTPHPSSTSTSIVFYTTTVPSALDDLDSTDTVIDDTDLRVVYSGSWTENLNEGGVPSKTSHSTLTKGSSLVVNFSGTGIDVLGLTHIGGNVISVSFAIDGGNAQAGSVSGTGVGITDPTYFSVRNLENKQHTLELTVGDGVNPRVFSIDCFVVTGASPSGSPSSSSTSVASGVSAATVSATTTIAVPGSGINGTSSLSGTTTASGQTLSPSSASLGLDLSSISPTSSQSGHGSDASSAASSPVDPNDPAQLLASNHNHMSAGQIAGTVIGTLLGIALLVAFFLTLCRWRAIKKRKLPSRLDTTPSPLFTNASETASAVERGIRHEKSNPEFEELSPPEYEFIASNDRRVDIPYYRTV